MINNESHITGTCEKIVCHGDKPEEVCKGVIEYDANKGYSICSRCRTIYRDTK